MLSAVETPLSPSRYFGIKGSRRCPVPEVELRSIEQPGAAVPTWLGVEHETIIFSARRKKVAAINS
jgi:hypothetical protein